MGDKDSPQFSITERPICITGGTTLFGVVTEPRSGEKRRRAVILLNPGADFHIGASRMYVSLARRWARCGYVVLRLDLAGIGDSATRPDKVDDEVFPVDAINDIRSAVDFIRSRYSIGDMALAGLCSGAYHALRAAVEGVDVNRILLVNPQNYFWKKGMSLEQIQLAEVVHNPGLYRQRILSLHAWRRIFTGQADITRIRSYLSSASSARRGGSLEGFRTTSSHPIAIRSRMGFRESRRQGCSHLVRLRARRTGYRIVETASGFDPIAAWRPMSDAHPRQWRPYI